MGRGLCGAAAAWLAAAGVAVAAPETPAPKLSTAPGRPSEPAPPVSGSAGNILAEMWQRKVLSPESTQWSPEDMRLLLRVRRAESDGAIEFLKSRVGLAGYAVEHRPAGKPPKLRLTRPGLDRYWFLKTQEAIRFFEMREIDAKWIFGLQDLPGRALFTAGGLLTPEGEALYERARIGLPAHWRLPDGQVKGTTRPPPNTP